MTYIADLIVGTAALYGIYYFSEPLIDKVNIFVEAMKVI